MGHKFHIPVLGLGYSIDTPLKVARYGIASVVSVVDDDLTERMREFHSHQGNEEFVPIAKTDTDCRARRITAYLNLLDKLVNRQFDALIGQSFGCNSDIDRYFGLLPDSSTLKQGYELMMEYPECESKHIFGNILRKTIKKGSIDVNIMAKVDKMNYAVNGEFLGDENTDALAALRGFAMSNLNSSLNLSAGLFLWFFCFFVFFFVFFSFVLCLFFCLFVVCCFVCLFWVLLWLLWFAC